MLVRGAGQRPREPMSYNEMAEARRRARSQSPADESPQLLPARACPLRQKPAEPPTSDPSDRLARPAAAATAAATRTHVIQHHHQHHRPRHLARTHTPRWPWRPLVLVALVAGVLLAASCRAYQLTNNLIANNLPPKFVQAASGSSEIVVRVKEGAQSIGKLIYTLKAEDPDEDPLSFGVLGTMASELLRIENTPGNQANVYLRKELDRETTESHQVVITLTDGKLGKGNWITKSMLIIVEDVNDNYPVFGPHRTAISIREDARAPLAVETLEASDADEGRFGQVIYKLDELIGQPGEAGEAARGRVEPSVSGVFAIETIDGKGVISLVGQLDYEQRPLYQLRVLAIDRAGEHERLSTSTSILISVEDCEDQAPMFTFAPSITRIPEDLAVGSPVLRLSAIDGDRGVNNPIKYSIVSVNNQESGYERNLFSIGSDSGQISVAHELDRELALGHELAGAAPPLAKHSATPSQPGAYVLQVRASEVSQQEGAADTSVTTELTLILTDVNDETPQFDRAHYFGELLENSPAESLVTFVLPPTATGGPPASDAPPPAAKVFDRDQGTNGTFTLHLEGEHGHLFDVWPAEATNEANVMIKVSGAGAASKQAARQLDFEQNKELRLTLVAREKFPPAGRLARRRFSQAELVIYLRDVNDNYPQFDTELYRVEIPENAQRGMHICVVKALDPDSGPFGSSGVRYTEVRGEKANKFKLDPVSGIITLKTNEHGFDRESVAQHHLIVEARDNNGLGNRNTTQLLIVLTDVNDQRPKFPLDQYEAFIYENEPDFQTPLQVQALDGDAPHTPNARLTYSIVAGDPQANFTIDPHTGRIRVRSSHGLTPAPAPALQRGTSAESDIVIAAEPHQTAAAGLDFERIAQKRDDTRHFNLTVRATDAGAPEPLWATTSVLVLVYDKNDHAPVFTRPLYAKSIREDAQPGSPVLQVQALDGDHSPSNSRITYRIASGASDKFAIDSDTGLITVATGANLDIDRAAQAAGAAGQRRTNYLLSILAFDGSFGPSQKSASALANITIIDLNNKAPEFVSLGASGQQQQLAAARSSAAGGPLLASTMFVSEDAPYGLIVTRVFATDLDSSAELRYSINYSRSEARNEEMALVEPNLYRDVFTIEPADGTIKVSKQLDRELFDQVKLRLQVEDLAAQTADQTSYTHLTIRITDVNDNRPTFKRPLYKAVVNENSISGTSVITLTADDRDLNKTLRYSLEASSPELARLVRINPRSGELTVNDKIDRELFPSINLTIKAEDFGQPHSLTGTCQLIVTVRDENDNNPIFLNATHLRPASAAPRQVELPGDTNGEPNGSAGELPRNHNNNNQAYRQRSLDGDEPPQHPASSAAGDGQPLDEQGQPLALLAPGATALVREDAPVGHQLAYVRAEDADLGNNGRVTYLLDAGASGSAGKFRIDRDSGVLSVAQALDRETQHKFTLIIEACDNYDLGYSTGESRRAFTQVNIQLTDVNDNAPQLTTNLQASGVDQAAGWPGAAPATRGYPTYDQAMNSPGPHELALAECLYISEFQTPHEPILTITATDLDDPDTAGGQIDLAIMNNLPANEMFALVEAKSAGRQQAGVADVAPSDEPVSLNLAATLPAAAAATTTTTSTPTSSEAADLSGFGDPLLGSESRDSVTAPRQLSRRLKRSPAAKLDRQLEPGNFYSLRPATRANQMGAGMATTPRSSTSFAQATGQKLLSGERQMHLVVSQSLKEKVGNYSILVRASDRGQPALSSIKLINVCVQDVNNHAPVFTRPPLNHTIRIMENATIGSFVTQVEATDLDHGLNSEIQYALKPTNIQAGNSDWQSFKIDRLSGVISTTKLFNRQLKKYYTLRVQAQDFGRPTSLSSDIDIIIMIVNSGKYQPEFEHQLQMLQFTENSAPGNEWFTLLQTTNLDDDPALIHVNTLLQPTDQKQQQPQPQTTNPVNGSNWISSPCYYIVDGDDHEQMFSLDRYTHRLTNQRELDRERKANYTLIVRASNNCNQPPVVSTGAGLAALAPSSGEPQAQAGAQVSSEIAEAAVGPELRRLARDTRSPLVAQHLRASKRIDAPDEVELATTRPPAARQAGAELVSPTAGSSQLAALGSGWDAQVAGDKSLLKVSISIRDLNDNAPKFTQRIYTGGITTEADFGTTFMIVQAIDPDAGPNGQVAYSIVRPIKRNLSLSSTSSSSSPGSPPSSSAHDRSGPTPMKQRRADGSGEPAAAGSATGNMPTPGQLQFPFNTNIVNEVYTNEQPSGQQSSNELTGSSSSLLPDGGDELFVISAQTGEISLNFDPQKHMKGYFEFEIIARDQDGLMDRARVLIYLLRQDQRVKFVLRLTPQELRQRLNKFRSVMGNITGAIVNIDSYKYFENQDGTVDKKKTSLFLHFVKSDENTIIEVDKVLTLIDNNIEYLDELYKEFHVLSSEAAHLPLNSGALVDPIDQVRTGLMGISSFLALILVLVIALCLNQRTRYERQLKAATVSAFGGPPLHLDPEFHSQTNLPNTNLHSQDPNPIWINGHYGNGHARADDPSGQLDWLGGLPATAAHQQPRQTKTATTTAGATATATAATATAATGKRASQTTGAAKGQRGAGQQEHHKLYHSASSGVGMALEDDGDEDDQLDCLSSSEGDHSCDLNSLNGGATQIHYTLATATATPRDSLNSSHGQVSSSSGSNSASTTNERQSLCANGAKLKTSQQQQQSTMIGAKSGRNSTTKVKLNINTNGTTNNSTFGAFKEVTIYTESQRKPAASQQARSFSDLVAEQQCQVPAKPTNLARQGPTSVASQQQATSHVNKLASQFDAAKLQRHSIYLVGNQHHQQQPQHANQGVQKSRILVHTNGADVNQGIIKSAKQSNNLDAKFVPDNREANQQRQQDQNVTNFETSLSKLSILNLETTEL